MGDSVMDKTDVCPLPPAIKLTRRTSKTSKTLNLKSREQERTLNINIKSSMSKIRRKPLKRYMRTSDLRIRLKDLSRVELVLLSDRK
jgi:hypothetical protein